MSETARPLPIADPDTAPFWEGCRRHELRAQRCRGCGALRWPPRGVCPRCHAWAFEWIALDRRGTVASFVVVHRATHPAFAAAVPYVIAQIAIEGTDGAVRLLTNVVGRAWEDVRVGMPGVVEFVEVAPGVSLPQFRPAAP